MEVSLLLHMEMVFLLCPAKLSSQAKEFLKALASGNTEYLKLPQTQLEKLAENVEKKDNLGLFHLMAMPKSEKRYKVKLLFLKNKMTL